MHLDPALHQTLRTAYNNAKIIRKQKAGPTLDPKTGLAMEPIVIPEDALGGRGGGIGTNVYSVYADPENPESWHHYALHHAKMVVSCMLTGLESKTVLAKDLAKDGVPFLAVVDSDVEAHSLYAAGCRYVIQQEFLAAQVIQSLLANTSRTSSRSRATRPTPRSRSSCRPPQMSAIPLKCPVASYALP
ncbi:hypothetical protein T484DRAFT_2789515 [Baffinella frigidus]|nr:hypothetical protein T484DRAFT_2789515 [Cryptophyta sp. CCMP2293]